MGATGIQRGGLFDFYIRGVQQPGGSSGPYMATAHRCSRLRGAGRARGGAAGPRRRDCNQKGPSESRGSRGAAHAAASR
eukprot:5506130-Prymnesium_polylepis.1